MALSWGIVGVSKISHDFCVALSSNTTKNTHSIVAVASRNKNIASEFAKRHSIERSYGTYTDLGKDADVKVVYIAVLNPMHFEICKLMIEYGKHVVCEKPFCMNYRQVKKVLSLAKSKQVFVMEGLWSRFFPVYRHLSQLIEMKSLGEIKEIYIKHGFIATNSNRVTRKDLGGGIVLDIGVFAIQFVLLVFREQPKTIKATGKINANGVDLHFEAELIFSGGRKAFIVCSGLEEYDNQATIISSKGPICIPTYWCPTKLMISNRILHWPLEETQIPLNYINTMGLKYEADAVMSCIRAGKLFSNIVTPDEMLIIAQIEDEIRKQIGVGYECDKI